MWKGVTVTVNPDINLTLAGITAAPPIPEFVDDVDRTLDFFGLYRAAVETAEFRTVRRVADLEQPKVVVWGLQCPPAVERSNIFSVVRSLHAAGIRTMTLAYSGSTQYGGGFVDPRAELTNDGKQLLMAMAEIGMILDLSHMSDRSVHDALNHIESRDLRLPVYASHSGCVAVYDHKRNLSVDLLRRVAEHDGVVGIPTESWMLGRSGNQLETVITHLMHAVDVVGAEHVAIGSDGIYTLLSEAEASDNFHTVNRLVAGGPVDPFGARFPHQPDELEEAGVHRMAVLAEYLDGYFLDQDFARVCGLNARSFFERALAA